MTTDFTGLHRNLLEHYVRLAQTQGWGQYTRERLKVVAREPGFENFPELVRQALAALSAPSSSPTAAAANPTRRD
jgi:hypothetical protein